MSDDVSRKIDALVAEKIYGWVWKPWPLNPEQKCLVRPDYEFGVMMLWLPQYTGFSALLPNAPTALAHFECRLEKMVIGI